MEGVSGTKGSTSQGWIRTRVGGQMRDHIYSARNTRLLPSAGLSYPHKCQHKRHICSIFQNQRAMDLQGRLILWWLLLKRYVGFRQMPFSASKLAQCLIQGDSLRKQRRQGRESHNVSITLLGIIKGRRKIMSERERKEWCSRFLMGKNSNNNNNNNNKIVF